MKEYPSGFLSGYFYKIPDFLEKRFYAFEIKTLNDPKQKGRGYSMACYTLAWDLPENEEDSTKLKFMSEKDLKQKKHLISEEDINSNTAYHKSKKLIKKYTGIDFKYRWETQKWLQKNQSFLRFSEEKQMLTVVKPEPHSVESK